MAGAIALVVLLGLGYFALRHSPAAAVAVTAPTRAAATPAAAIASNSIAVLPLANFEHSDPDQQYFSDGLSESLITALAQIPALKVIGKSSSFLFRDSKESSHQIGEQLSVARLLVGSVERFGGQIRVSAGADQHLGRHQRSGRSSTTARTKTSLCFRMRSRTPWRAR